MLNFVKLCVILALIILHTGAAPPNEGRIVGGQETSISLYPYQVSVRLDTYILLHICGGSIYTPRIIITAAHCLKGRYPAYIYVVAGKSTIDDEADVGIIASKLIYHAGYNKNTHDNDIGLIILSKALTYTDVIQPIALSNDYPLAGQRATITGWGKSDEDSQTLTNELQMVEVEIVNRQICSAKYASNNYVITEQMVCAGIEAGGKDACQGDSGGPLAAEGYLIGVVSWGIGCARPDYPGVYASTAYHKQWIEEMSLPYL